MEVKESICGFEPRPAKMVRILFYNLIPKISDLLDSKYLQHAKVKWSVYYVTSAQFA